MKKNKKINEKDSTNSALMAEISKSQQQWQATIDAVTDYIFVTDEDSSIRRANISFAKIFNKHPREIIGLNVKKLFPVDIPLPQCDLKETTKSDVPASMETKIGDNTYMISVYPAKYDDDEVCVYVMKDITEIMKLRDQLFHSYKLTSLGQLVSGAAHEINNPLAGILGFTEMLRMKAKDDNIKTELAKIHKAAERCKYIVESLLCFSRQQLPKKTLEYFNDIIDRTIDLRIYWLKKNNIEIVKEYGKVPLSYTDGQQIQQALLNIIMNAEQAIAKSNRKGRIVINTSYDNASDKIIIKISDNGMGISQDNIHRIFDPFFTTKPVGQGTGLGLSISYGIISEHGGTIRVDSKKDKGTTFVIELPLKKSLEVSSN